MKRLKPVLVVTVILVAIIIAFWVWYNPTEGPSHKILSSQEIVPVSVAVGTWAGYGNIYVAIEKGYFYNLKVSAIVMDDSNSRRAAYSGPGLDIMMSTIDQFAIEAGQGLPGGILIVTDESYGSDGVVARSGITSVEQLKGKRVAYTPGLAGEYLLGRALEGAGLSRQDVQLVPIDNPDGGLAAFLSEQVDAAVSWEPHISEVVSNKKGHVLFTSRDISEAIVDILVAKDTITANPNVLQTFLDGWLKAGDFIKTHPDEAYTIIAKGLNVKPEDVQEMMDGLKLADRARNVYFLGGSPPEQIRCAKLFDAAAAYWRSLGTQINNTSGSQRIPHEVNAYFRK
jgi:NitT/TauT family transport system substrate-binding protein